MMNVQRKSKQLLPKILKTLNPPPPPEKGSSIIQYICRQDGAQDREFAANRSPSPTEREDGKCFAIYLSLWDNQSFCHINYRRYFRRPSHTKVCTFGRGSTRIQMTGERQPVSDLSSLEWSRYCLEAISKRVKFNKKFSNILRLWIFLYFQQ
jgi:hypothetical protein